MATSNAEFTIDGDPFSSGGHDGTNGQSVDLQLASPGGDVRQVVYSVVSKSKDAPDLSFSAGASPTTPADALSFTLPATGSHSWLVQAQINGGVDSNNDTVRAWTKQRIIAIRNQNGLRKIVPVETDQYSAVDGWSESYNDLVEAEAGVGAIELITGTVDADLVTADATPVTVATVPIPTDESLVISATTRGHDATAGDSCAMQVASGFKNIAGTVTELALVSNKVRDDATWDLALTISGTDVLVQITGDATNGVTWKLHVEAL